MPSIWSWKRSRRGSGPGSRGKRRTNSSWARYRPRFEPLEDRYLLSGGGAGGAAGGGKGFAAFAKGSSPVVITNGLNGNLYFTQFRNGNAGSLAPNGTTTIFGSPPGVTFFNDITAGADKNVWFTGSDGKIWRMTPQGQFTSFPITDGTFQGGYLQSITTGPDGNLWFGVYAPLGSVQIGRLTPTGQLTEFNLPNSLTVLRNTVAGFKGITTGPDGNIWFSLNGNVAEITPKGDVTAFTVPGANFAGSITTGPDGNVWFTYLDLGLGTNGIAKITPTGAVTEFALPAFDAFLSTLTAGPDGNVWFTSIGTFDPFPGHVIGQITPTGAVTEYTTPSDNSMPTGITTGPDGALWITDPVANLIWQFTPGSAGGGTSVPVTSTTLTATLTTTHADSQSRDATLPLPTPPPSATDPTAPPILGDPSRGGPPDGMACPVGEHGIRITVTFVSPPPSPTDPPQVSSPVDPSPPAPLPAASSPATPTPSQASSAALPTTDVIAALATARLSNPSTEVNPPDPSGAETTKQPVQPVSPGAALIGDLIDKRRRDGTPSSPLAPLAFSPPVRPATANGMGWSISSVGLQEIPSSEQVFGVEGLDAYFARS